MKKAAFCLAVSCLMLCGCHESMSKRAEREAKEYTQKYCPTPIQNCTRTDSVVFDSRTNTFIYYCSIFDQLDDKAVFDMNRSRITEGLISNLKENTQLRAYKKEGFGFKWILTSAKNSKTVYYNQLFTAKDYGTPNTLRKD